MINNYSKFILLLETVQKSDKILGEFKDNIEWVKIKNRLIREGYSNYLGWISEWILDKIRHDDYTENENDYNIILERIKEAIEYKIDISKVKFDNIPSVTYDLKRIRVAKNFINKWCPASIRNTLNKDEASKYLLNNIDIYYFSRLLTKDMILVLKKGSLSKSFEDWVGSIKPLLEMKINDLNILKELGNIEIKLENDNFLVYSPLDYQSYTIIYYAHWCLRSENMWNSYKKRNSKFWIICNKNDIEKSIIIECNNQVTIHINSYSNKQIDDNLIGLSIDDVINKLIS